MKILRNLPLCLVSLFTVLLLSGNIAYGDVKLHALFADHMVLQRGATVPVWGTADVGEKMTVAIGGQTLAATADTDGKWRVNLAPLKEGAPLNMTVTGKNTITINDILVGEVWVCSGQSNMNFRVRGVTNATEEIAAANYPKLRHFQIQNTVAPEPREDCAGKWTICTPETVADYTAVGYFYGRELLQQLNVPIGLIHTSWGGTPAEAWTSLPVLEAMEEAKPIFDRYAKALENYPKALEKHKEKLAAHREKVKSWQAKRKAEGAEAAGRRPRAPRPPMNEKHPCSPAGLFNGMINPLIPFAIKGAIWYQGESNAGRAYQYRTLFPAMIADWRDRWDQGDFPFYFVQLANFRTAQTDPNNPSTWAELREAQLMTLSRPNTGMACIIDIGEADDIHPRNKQDVGKRLALWALAKDYGKDVVYSGPLFRSATRKDKSMVLNFDHVAEGLVTKGEKLTGFTIAGEDQKLVWADAVIEGNTVVVSSPAVPEPVAVRYGWADNPPCNLYNSQGLPASPFRTDAWKGVTADKF